MIYTTLDHVRQYYKISENLEKGLQFLTQTDLSKLEDGRIEIDGEKVFAILRHYDTRPDNSTPETHQAYIDIQYAVDGKEYIGVAPLTAMEETAEADPEGDIWFHHGKVDHLLLENDRLAILFPEDAHAPGIAVDTPAWIRKCVIKVLAKD